jgi:hypothetical protein
LISNNLNTHVISSFYEAFPTPIAWKLAKRLEIHHAPKHGDRLNIAEIVISILARQCLCRRIPNLDLLVQELLVWNLLCDAEPKSVNWQFTADDARLNLKYFYTSF